MFNFGWKTYVVQESPPGSRRTSYGFGKDAPAPGRYRMTQGDSASSLDDSNPDYEIIDVPTSPAPAPSSFGTKAAHQSQMFAPHTSDRSHTYEAASSADRDGGYLYQEARAAEAEYAEVMHNGGRSQTQQSYDGVQATVITIDHDGNGLSNNGLSMPGYDQPIRSAPRAAGGSTHSGSKPYLKRPSVRSTRSGNTNVSTGSMLSKLPLPSGWEQDVNEDGLVYFLNHNDMSTHWCHPLERDPDLPPGWENVRNDYGMYYLNHNEGLATYDHPGKSRAAFSSLVTDEELAAASILHSHILRKAVTGVDEMDAAAGTMPYMQMGAPLSSTPPEWLVRLVVDPIAIGPVIDWSKFSDDELEHYLSLAMDLFDEEISHAHSFPPFQRQARLERIALRKEIVAEEFHHGSQRQFDVL